MGAEASAVLLSTVVSYCALQLLDNEISALPPEIGQLTRLQRLSVRTALRRVMGADGGRDANLLWQILRNRLESLPSEISQLKELSYLDVRCILSPKAFGAHRLTLR